MNINIHTKAIAELQADVLAWPITSELEFSAELNGAAGDLLGELVETGETKGKAAELTILHSPLVESIRRHYLIGVGDTLDADSIFKAAGQAVRDALKRGAKRLAVHLSDEAFVRPAIEGALYGSYQNAAYKKNDEVHTLDELILCGSITGASEQSGDITGQAVNLTRELVNMPANDLGPHEFAARADVEG